MILYNKSTKIINKIKIINKNTKTLENKYIKYKNIKINKYK